MSARIEVLEGKVTERPRYHDFGSVMDDVVARGEIGKELVLKAKLRGPSCEVRPGMALDFEGQKFAVQRSDFQIEVHPCRFGTPDFQSSS